MSNNHIYKYYYSYALMYTQKKCNHLFEYFFFLIQYLIFMFETMIFFGKMVNYKSKANKKIRKKFKISVRIPITSKKLWYVDNPKWQKKCITSMLRKFQKIILLQINCTIITCKFKIINYLDSEKL